MVNDPRPRRRWAASYGLSLLLHALVFLLLAFVAIDIESGTTEIAGPSSVQIFEVGAPPTVAPSATPVSPAPVPSGLPSVTPARPRPVAVVRPSPATPYRLRPAAGVPHPRSSGPPLPPPELARNVLGAVPQTATARRSTVSPLPEPSPVQVVVATPDPSTAAAGVTELPSLAPVAPTLAPTAAPTALPTAPPTLTPTAIPTRAPTAAPTLAPTAAPTLAPTAAPTLAPTAEPTVAPTLAPTAAPTLAPTVAPTAAPTIAPPRKPVALVSPAPSAAPSASVERAAAQRAPSSPGPRRSAAPGGNAGPAGGHASSAAGRPAGAGPAASEVPSGTAPRADAPAPTENPATRSINDRLKELTISGNVDYTPKRVALGDAQGVFDAAMAAYEARFAPPADILSRTFGFIYERRSLGHPDSLAYVYDVFSVGPIKMCRAWKIVEHPYEHVAEVGAVAGSAGIGGAVASSANSPDIRHESGGADVQTVVFPCTEKSYTAVARGSLTTPLPLHPRSPGSPKPASSGAPAAPVSRPVPAASLAP